MAAKPTQSREGVKGQLPPCGVKGRSTLVGFGATPQPFHGRPVMPNALNPAALVAGSAASLRSNFARPQTRPQAAFPTTCTLSRQMDATDQHRERFISRCWSFSLQGDFASAEARRGALRSPPPPLRSAHTCCLISIVAEGFRIHPCKSNAQILPHSKSRRVLPQCHLVNPPTSYAGRRIA